MSLHQRTQHPTPVEGCFGCKVSTLHIAHSSEWSGFLQRERELTDDLDAYKRMRQDGLKPEAVTGAADVERHATHRIDVEQGKANPLIKRMTAEQKDIYAAVTSS